MSTKLQPTQGEIPEIEPAQRVMKLRCVGKGEALWAHFDLLFPIVITSRKYLGHLPNGAAQDVEVMAVKVDGKMHKSLPGIVGPGKLDIIMQGKGSTSIELELMCRIEAEVVGEPAEAGSVESAIEELTRQEHKPRPEDPAMRPRAVDPRPKLEVRDIMPDGDLLSVGDGPFPVDLPPAVAAKATEDLKDMMVDGDMDDATRKSLQAFIDADGDPTQFLQNVSQGSTVDFGRNDDASRKGKLESV